MGLSDKDAAVSIFTEEKWERLKPSSIDIHGRSTIPELSYGEFKAFVIAIDNVLAGLEPRNPALEKLSWDGVLCNICRRFFDTLGGKEIMTTASRPRVPSVLITTPCRLLGSVLFVSAVDSASCFGRGVTRHCC
jgi:hypothetical protein